MRQLKFHELLKIKVFTESNFNSPACSAAFRAFDANTKLAISPAGIPGFNFWMAHEWAWASIRAGAGEATAKSQEEREAIVRAAHKDMFESLRFSAQYGAENVEDGTVMMVDFTQRAGGAALCGLDSIFKSLITGAWTSIEVLSEMLWNLTHEEMKNFPALSATQESKLGFRSRLRIRASYRIGYAVDSDILGALNEKCIDALSLLRNVIVHCAGFADDDFLEGIPQATPYLDMFVGLGKNDEILLDGEIVREIIDSSFLCGYRLITAVDEWMTRNP